MYNFVDVNQTSEAVILPSEALRLNGEYIENLIPGYRTLHVEGREALSPEVDSFTVGSSDGASIKNKRYPERIITITYQLIAKSNEEFREAYNQLAKALDVEEAELIFNDEPDKFFRGTPSSIEAVSPGKNAVIGTFELLCADPFKYSVIEYEAEPNEVDGSFLINYNGTHKAYPTLEAEFYKEDDPDLDIGGIGDCGYVAFFNEEEKIIQLGDPSEPDVEEYPKSQTLVSQNFNAETAWGAIAQQNWASNRGVLPALINAEQVGSYGIAVGHHTYTTAPSTTGTLLNTSSKEQKPYVYYTVTAKTASRLADRVNVEVTITGSLTPPSKQNSTTTKQETPTLQIAAGVAVSLNNTGVYYSSTSSSPSYRRSGTYYLWDGSVISGRLRITNSKSNVGVSGQVTGWVNASDIGAASTSSGSSSSVSTSGSLPSKYVLKAGIQFPGGDWTYVYLKKAGTAWSGDKSYSQKVTVTVKGLDADTTVIEDIKFKVERTDKPEEDEEETTTGILEETLCKALEISTYTAPIPASWYLMPTSYGTGSAWHGPSITRTIPADKNGDVGAKNFTLTYKQKMSIGTNSIATQELGMFSAMLLSGIGNNRKIVAGVSIVKSANGKTATVNVYANGGKVWTKSIDLSFNNKYFGNNSTPKNIKTVKTTTITKTGQFIIFNIGGITKTIKAPLLVNTAVTEITFHTAGYGTKPTLSCNGLYFAKFVKHNCETLADIPNKFGAYDVVVADCKSGEIYLNDSPTPSLGALGNDWEEFYLTPGLNQIGFSYSDWLDPEFAPTAKIRYREVFI